MKRVDFIFKALNGDEFERRLKNQLNQTQIARECADWLAKNADIGIVNLV